MKPKRRLSLTALFINLALAAFTGGIFAIAMGQPELTFLFAPLIFAIGTGPQLVAGFANRYKKNHTPPVGLLMALQTEVWAEDVAENIYPKNSFINQSLDDSMWLKNKTVHLPQAGTKPNVEVNRTSLPASITRREDGELNYEVEEFTTDPVLLTNSEEIEVSYAKRASVLFDHMEQIRTTVAEKLLTIWGATGGSNSNFVRTSGGTRAAGATAQTGNRKALAKADLIAARTILTNMDIPEDGRILVIDGVLYGDLLGLDDFKTLEQLGSKVITDGAIGRIMGFDVFLRSSVLRYTNDGTPVMKAFGTAKAATDNLSALVFHKNFVRSAFGNTENGGVLIFERQNDPTFYGDVFSALVRAGGSKKYSNERGIVSIIETTV